MSSDLLRRPTVLAGSVVAVLVAIVVVAAAVGLFLVIEASEPDLTRLTVENPTDAKLQVAVKSSPDDALLPVTTLEPQTSRTLGSVIDQGERWIFVAGWGDVRGEFTVTRDELEASDWTVRLPASIAARVHAEYPPLDIDEPTAPSS